MSMMQLLSILCDVVSPPESTQALSPEPTVPVGTGGSQILLSTMLMVIPLLLVAAVMLSAVWRMKKSERAEKLQLNDAQMPQGSESGCRI